MRKSLFLTLVLSLCALDFGANAAVAQRGNARGGNTQQASATNTNTQQSVVSARAATRRQVTNNTAPVSGNVAARAATKQTKANVVAARAGSTQKVINTGTKVATATENTMVPQECQDAFYGCMDAFCMLDNASGGRCQCNDKITELDTVLEDILKLDEQSYIMATEGVERIQMGEAESEIMARAKAAGEKAASGNSAEENRKKARTLDLSVFDNNIFSEQDEDEVFVSQDTQNALLNKKGTALFNETTKLCGAQIPAQCKTYGSMLQLVYAQKIKSDCIAYENSLKAQKNQSQQKLQTAQKALRDAALDEYKNQNKYATVGECVIAFTDCVKTTGECGDDYTGCVTFAAQENLKNDKKGTKAKQTKIKGSKGGADITLAASTMEQLMAKKLICERVTKQCVNANKNDAVWNAFLRNAAPALKSAELIAEQNLRSNCTQNIADCFQKACKTNFGDGDSYDMCLSNPETYKSLCKVQLEPCLEATGGDYNNPEKSSLWNRLLATLNAMKVDACTKEVKDCLLSEDRCGKDYAGCIGLDTKTIGDLCPYEKLTACMSKEYPDYNTAEDGVRAYVAQIAQGLALQIDDSMAKICENAAQEAMIKACGDTETCDNATFDLGALESDMKVVVCSRLEDPDMHQCYPSVAMVPTTNLTSKQWYAALKNKPDISKVSFASSNDVISEVYNLSGERKIVSQTKSDSGNVRFYGNEGNSSQIANILNNALDRMIAQIESDPKVTYCMEGRTVQGFDSAKFVSEKGKQQPRFPNLIDEYKTNIANALMSKLSAKNLELTSKFDEQIAAIDKEITELVYANDEKETDKSNEDTCLNKHTYDPNRCFYTNYNGQTVTKSSTGKCCCGNISKAFTYQLTEKVASYDAESNICTVETKQYNCIEEKYGFFGFGNRRCVKYDDGKVINTQNLQMGKSH